MFEHERRTHSTLRGLTKRLAADLSEAQFWEQPAGLNPPGWILGHLTASNDSGAQLLGQPPRAPAAWNELFGIGSSCAVPAEKRPGKAELLEQFDQTGAAFAEAAAAADPTHVWKAYESPLLKGSPIQCVGDMVVFMLTGHLAFHVGQLSAWRRANGFAPLF